MPAVGSALATALQQRGRRLLLSRGAPAFSGGLFDQLASSAYSTRKNVHGGPCFARVAPKDIDHFRSIFASEPDGGRAGVVQDSDDLERYNVDWTGKYRGSSKVALRPSTREQVAQILSYCNAHRLPVTPQGGNTGLVGGAVPVDDEIVLSLERMNRIISHDALAGVLTVEAGVILETADNYLRERSFVMPLDLGAKGSCMIGGNIATNAGGLRLLRYGSLHGSVVGIEAVMADGTILDGLNVNRKDNTGIDYKQVLIGSEGTLAIITKAAILTPPAPISTSVAVLAVASFEAISKIFVQARHSLDGAPFYVLIETSGSRPEHDEEKVMGLLESLQEASLITDGTIARDETQARHLWSLRESIPEACARFGRVHKYDVSLPQACMYDAVSFLRTQLAPLAATAPGADGIIVTGYGHFGDGNIHLNVVVPPSTVPDQEKTILAAIEPAIYDFVRGHRGSISAEHGIGSLKAKYLASHARGPGEVALMRRLKALFDPNGILNPYKMMPPCE